MHKRVFQNFVFYLKGVKENGISHQILVKRLSMVLLVSKSGAYLIPSETSMIEAAFQKHLPYFL